MKTKFKAQRTDGNGWVEGYYVYRPDGKHLIYWQPFDEASMNTYHEVIPETVCIGVQHKDSWIFSGDEMQHHNLGRGIVSFDGFGFMITYPDENNYCLPLHEDINELVLTGRNIHDKQ